MRKGTSRWPDVRAIREELGISQTEMASFLGVSPRTVQSCEQGWRSLSCAVEKSLLLLLMMFRRKAQLNELACWEARGCRLGTREQCLAYISRQGHMCWYITGNFCKCQPMDDWESKKEACKDCSFFKELFRDDSQKTI
ncbi:MAG: helix-turn-helix domain-containing protein [Armatimonadota bacterium]